MGESPADFLHKDADAAQHAQQCQRTRPENRDFEGVDFALCKPWMDVFFRSQDGTIKASSYNGTFVGGHLVRISVISIFGGSTYDIAKADFTKKSGITPVERVAKMQNAYGAKWSNRTATWTSKELVATLTENRNPGIPSANDPWALAVEERSYHDSVELKESKRPSPLDP